MLDDFLNAILQPYQATQIFGTRIQLFQAPHTFAHTVLSTWIPLPFFTWKIPTNLSSPSRLILREELVSHCILLDYNKLFTCLFTHKVTTSKAGCLFHLYIPSTLLSPSIQNSIKFLKWKTFRLNFKVNSFKNHFGWEHL